MRDFGKIVVMALVLLGLAVPNSAFAYIGPGIGAGAIGAVLGVLGSIVVGIFAVVWYPIKRILKKRRQSKTDEDAD